MDKKQEYQDNTDRIKVERFLAETNAAMAWGCIATKLEETQLTSIVLSVFVSNLFRIQKRILLAFIWLYHRYVVYASRYEIERA